MKMPHMEIYEDIDASYPNQFKASNEYFFLCKKSSMPWECAVEGDGSGFFEVSTLLCPTEKCFAGGATQEGNGGNATSPRTVKLNTSRSRVAWHQVNYMARIWSHRVQSVGHKPLVPWICTQSKHTAHSTRLP